MKRDVGVVATVIAAVLVATVVAQPAPRVFAIRDARIVTLAGPSIERGTLVVENGLIAGVGAVPIPAGAEVIDGSGLQVYPGFFDAMSQLGIAEIGQVPASADAVDVGDLNPQLVAITAVNPSSEHLPVARVDGITHALVAPGRLAQGASVIAGQASVVALAGWTIEDMLIERSVGVVVSWPSLRGGGPVADGDAESSVEGQRSPVEAKREYDRRIGILKELFDRARRVPANASANDTDPAVAAVVPVVKGTRPLIVLADREESIRAALEFARLQNVRIVLAGGSEAWRVKTELAERRVPVILGPTLALPDRQDDRYDKPLTRAGELFAAGVTIAFGSFSSAASRTLPFQAGNAVAHGLPWEEALKAISRNPAQILGFGQRLGTLETGKVANLIVTNGDPLEMRTTVAHVFINGELVPLASRHRSLYERYRARPRPTSGARDNPAPSLR